MNEKAITSAMYTYGMSRIDAEYLAKLNQDIKYYRNEHKKILKIKREFLLNFKNKNYKYIPKKNPNKGGRPPKQTNTLPAPHPVTPPAPVKLSDKMQDQTQEIQ